MKYRLHNVLKILNTSLCRLNLSQCRSHTCHDKRSFSFYNTFIKSCFETSPFDVTSCSMLHSQTYDIRCGLHLQLLLKHLQRYLLQNLKVPHTHIGTFSPDGSVTFGNCRINKFCHFLFLQLYYTACITICGSSFSILVFRITKIPFLSRIAAWLRLHCSS